MMEELQTLMCQEIPEGRQSIKDSHTNLEKVAEYCEANYFQAENKTQALEESKKYTTQSLASVAYQINTLAFNLLHLLDLQTAQLASVESQVNHIAQTVSIHKEKVARREIGVLTTNKNTIRQHKILAPANQEKQVKYVRKPIDYSALDGVGHAARIVPQTHGHPQSQSIHGVVNYSQTAPRARRSSSSSGQGPAGPAPTQKPPTPPGQQMGAGGMSMGGGGGTLRRSEYRSTPPIAPPQLPNNYAPNYPMGSAMMGPNSIISTSGGPRRSASNCSTLPHPQVTAGHGVTRSEYLIQQQQLHQQQMMSHYRQGMMVPVSSAGGTAAVQHHPDSQHMMGTHAMGLGHGAGVHYSSNHGHAIPGGPTTQIGSSQRAEALPAPPANMMAPAGSSPAPPPPVSSSNGPTTSVTGNMPPPPPPPGGNISPPLPPPPEELSSPPTAASNASSGTTGDPTGQRGSSSSGEPAWAPANYLEKVVAIYDYQADKADELSFAENALIYVIKKNDDGWYEGVMDGVQGLFPGNYVEPCM
ncbi:abl interactor 2-like [Varroa jacobsoni]|uniref:abl interactor 2-like n=1 Tax=Varroa jacobsoni TaxID=62625 RepID=UPI000BF2C898|nr:abl interactor 2-like [Varroa jacobsoni]